MKTFSVARYCLLLALFLYQYLNAAIVSAYMIGVIGLMGVTVFQLAYLGSLIFLVYRKKQEGTTRSKSLKWLGAGFLVLVLVSYLVSSISAVSSSNQEALLQVFGQLPVPTIILFLINASMVEELVYRGLLWEVLPGRVSKVVLTSMGFALAHQPDSFTSFILYASMGLVLGTVRHQAGLKTAISLHTLWNIFVLGLTQLV